MHPEGILPIGRLTLDLFEILLGQLTSFGGSANRGEKPRMLSYGAMWRLQLPP
jgi:hypothetical protein